MWQRLLAALENAGTQWRPNWEFQSAAMQAAFASLLAVGWLACQRFELPSGDQQPFQLQPRQP